MAFYTGVVQIKDLVSTIASKLALNGWTETPIQRMAYYPTYQETNPTAYTLTATVGGATGCHINGAFDPSYLQYNQTATANTVTLDLGVGISKTFTHFAICYAAGQYRTKSYTVSGSTNNSTWTTLLTVTNYVHHLNTSRINGTQIERVVTPLTTTGSFRYYRFVEVASEDNTGAASTSIWQINNIEFMEGVSAAQTLGLQERVFTSTGTSGTESLRFSILPGNTNSPTYASHLYFNVYETYYSDPNNGYGVFHPIGHCLSGTANAYSASTNTNAAGSTLSSYAYVEYNLVCDADHVILSTAVDPAGPGARNAITYLGLMNRYGTETTSDAVAFMNSDYNINSASYIKFNVLKNINGVTGQWYNVKYLQHDYAPSVWSNNYFLAPIVLEGVLEGVRGELKNCFYVRPENTSHGDILTIGSDQYKIVKLTANNGFIGYQVALKTT